MIDNEKDRAGYLEFRNFLKARYSREFVEDALWYDFDARELIDIYNTGFDREFVGHLNQIRDEYEGMSKFEYETKYGRKESW